ncbi:M15 family metallopeptidase [Paenibacillus methanolicus]|uniref:D-alanyl-D-alanine carboxypeptidase n=1 Tax=Paenibacillus methanolicus TaxID=582686 RepID=A0A5S5C400_9BACL|nr:M15 family metallopeptidase [Paenibacillus methanolicus]TYP74054.1 D-alanyl-D-alanine carboxypeptidase [Paenibacillus methanolicus]
MKKWVVLLLLAVLIGNSYMQRQQKEGDAGRMEGDAGNPTVLAAEKNGNRRSIELSEAQTYGGNLILVNSAHPVREEGVLPDIVALAAHPELTEGYGLLEADTRLSAAVAERFGAMIEAAAEDGVTHFRISSGYRDMEEQRRMYEAKGADYALPPGRSEHNTGLSLDVGSMLGEMGSSPEGEWLIRHAAEHGFILRYPKDKTEITGIQYEPWHFRYVGLPHSMIIEEHGLALEEYAAFLRKKGIIQAEANGERYEIQVVAVPGHATAHVPADAEVELSGDNQGGVIVTSRLK